MPDPTEVTALSGSDTALTQGFDVALLDLDGVVYVGPDAVPGVPAALEQARGAGLRLAFVTNNAARTPASVAAHLTELGVPATVEEVITSAQAAAHYLADRLPAGSAVLVVGTTGLVEALRERGLRPVDSADDQPAAVVQGYSPELSWRQLAEGAVAIRRGVTWVATNLDPTVPSPRGPLPGNGSLVAALRHATGVTPTSTGKPDPTMHRESVERSGAQRPIVVGDRLDTDIEGARAVGCASLLVLSGVTSAREFVLADPGHRPDFLARDAGGLLHAHPRPQRASAGFACGLWRAEVVGDAVHLSSARGAAGHAAGRSGAGAESADGLDGLRALASAVWSAPAAAGTEQKWTFRAEGEPAKQYLREFELD